MKAIKLVAILAILLASFPVSAICPTQETTVMFMNGVWTKKADALLHKEALAEDVYDKGISRNCVHFELSHTQDDGYITDVVESIIQKSQESNARLFSLVNMLFRNLSPDSIFLSMIAEVYLRHVGGVVDTQLDKHLQRFKDLTHIDDLDPAKRQRGIALAHSQGGLYGNALWYRLTPAEQSNTRLVTVATPADNVADGGPNTRLSRDGVANVFFANAFATGTIPNTGLCDKEVTTEANSWLCHGFETGYLHDVGARTKIVNDIIALLPQTGSTAAVSGLVTDTESLSPVAGVDVSICRLAGEELDQFCDIMLGETTSGSDGRYQFSNLPECSPCRVEAIASISNMLFLGRTDFVLNTGDAITADILMGPVLLQ